MAMSRNARRKLRREHLKAKALRLYNAEKAREAQARHDIVSANLATRPERNYYKGTISSVYAGSYAARAKGRGVSYSKI